jgi:hypothetical protein
MPWLNPSTLILSARLFDPMRHFAYALHMSRRKLKENRHKQALDYSSGFWSLVTRLFLSTVPVCAEWQAVEKDYLASGLQTVCIDPESIRGEGDLVTMLQLIDFTWMQGNPRGPTRFLSTKTHKKIWDVGKKIGLFLPFPFAANPAIASPHHDGSSRNR